MSLYLKYRPKTFDEIVGQPDAVKLMKAIVAQNPEDRPKVFLFGGASGCGKTTLATVFARAIGCDPDHSNFTVMDASKDRSIDRIRELCDMMGTRPIGKEAQARIFLLDECFEYHTPITCVDDNGKLFTKRIGEIVAEKLKTRVLSVNADGVLEPKEITGWFKNSNKPIKTYHFKKDGESKYGKSKYKITCSDNHRLFRPDGTEVTVAGLKIGDKIRIITPALNKEPLLYRQGNKRKCYIISKEAEEFMVGTLLGDTTMQCNTSKASMPRFRLVHSTKAKDYFMEKVRIFGDMMGAYSEIVNRGYGDRLIVGNTKSRMELKELYDNSRDATGVRFTDYLMDKFTAISLAALYCDDGSLSVSKYTRVDGSECRSVGTVSLATHSFCKEDVNKMMKMLHTKFGIVTKCLRHKDTDMYYIVCATQHDGIKFLSTVAPYIPECMSYKLGGFFPAGNGIRNIEPVKFVNSRYARREMYTATYVGSTEAEPWQLAHKHLYDIEVKDNHNYIAGGVVAHNCHQLLKPAQEALLKKCEDTPPQTIIIFATTEPDALGKALRSRCKIITINPMSNKAIYDNLNRVIKAEGIKIDDKDVIKIARASDGNTRVSLQILENYMLNGMNADNAISMCGGMGEELKVDTIEICRIIVGKKQNEWEKVAAFCAKYKGQGESARQAILGYLRSCILKSTTMKDRMRFATLIEVFSVPHYDCSDAALPMQIAFALEV